MVGAKAMVSYIVHTKQIKQRTVCDILGRYRQNRPLT